MYKLTVTLALLLFGVTSVKIERHSTNFAQLRTSLRSRCEAEGTCELHGAPTILSKIHSIQPPNGGGRGGPRPSGDGSSQGDQQPSGGDD